MLQFMGSQRVVHNWVTKQDVMLEWPCFCLNPLWSQSPCQCPVRYPTHCRRDSSRGELWVSVSVSHSTGELSHEFLVSGQLLEVESCRFSLSQGSWRDEGKGSLGTPSSDRPISLWDWSKAVLRARMQENIRDLREGKVPEYRTGICQEHWGCLEVRDSDSLRQQDRDVQLPCCAGRAVLKRGV